jgi:hypothetical protein
MTLSIGQIVAVFALVSALFAAGRMWEAHEQRISALEKAQLYSHGDVKSYLKE